MTTSEITNIAAVLMSPVIAVVISLWIQSRTDSRKSKLHVFGTLVGNRHKPICDDNLQALHLIDVVFSRHARVRELWREYMNMLGEQGLNNDPGFVVRRQKYREMLFEMARVLGFAGTMSYVELDRVYTPEGVAREEELWATLKLEFLRVLRDTKSLAIEHKQPAAGDGPLREVKPASEACPTEKATT